MSDTKDGSTQAAPLFEVFDGPDLFPLTGDQILTPGEIEEFRFPDFGYSYFSSSSVTMFSHNNDFVLTLLPPAVPEPDTFIAFATDAGERVRLAKVSDGTGLLSNDQDFSTGGLSITAVNGDTASVSTQGNAVRVEGSNGGIFRVFENGTVDFSFTSRDVDLGGTTGFDYTITDAYGSMGKTTVEVLWEETPANYDLFVAETPVQFRVARQSDGTAILAGEIGPDGQPIVITAINGDPDLVAPPVSTARDRFAGSNPDVGTSFKVFPGGVIDVRFAGTPEQSGAITSFEYTLSAPVNGSTTGVVDVALLGFATPDLALIYGDDLAAANRGPIRVGEISAGTGALANDVPGARIVSVNGSAANVGEWVNATSGGQMRVFEFGAVQFREAGRGVDSTGLAQIVYEIEAHGASGATLSTTFTVDLIDRPSEIFAADDQYALTGEDLSAASDGWLRLASVDDGGGDVLLENDFFVSEVTKINGADLQEGIFFDGSNGGQFRVFSGGVVDFVNRGPNKVAAGETTFFTYTGDQGNSATVRLSIGEFPFPDHFGSRLTGIDLRDRSGTSVSEAGDFNGDGYGDFLIGAVGADRAGAVNVGETYLIYGAEGGLPPRLDLAKLDGSNGTVIRGINNQDASGRAVASAGDFNGDGYGDILIGAPKSDDRQNGSGEAYLIYGTAADMPPLVELADLDGNNGFVLKGTDLFNGTGLSVSSAGDVNGDGFDDILIGAPRADTNGSNSGDSYVVYGTSAIMPAQFDLSNLDGTNGFVIGGVAATEQSGRSVASAGDINGDGFDDILIGAPGARNDDGPRSGEAYVVYGAATGLPARLDLGNLNGTNGFVISGVNFDDATGFSVSSAGDFNGDGLDDMLIGAPRADRGAAGSVGEAYLVYGTGSGLPARFDLATLDGTNGSVLIGKTSFSFSFTGTSVASAGDINGDGFDDILIGAPEGDRNATDDGVTYLVFGTASGLPAELDLDALDGTDGFIFKGISGSDRSGFSVSSAGDVNADGYDDLLIGANDANGNSISTGETYLVYGGTAILDAFDLADGTQDGAMNLSNIEDVFLL